MLNNKIAIVTGGARGIGEGIARILAEAGARVAILDLDGEQAAKSAAALPNGCIGMACDVADESAVADAVGAVVELSLIHISEPTRLLSISYAVFCLKKKTFTSPRPTASLVLLPPADLRYDLAH